MDQMVNNIQLTWKLAWLLRTYRICNLTVEFSKYKFYNKLLDGVILFRVIPDVTWTQLYIYTISYDNANIWLSSFEKCYQDITTVHLWCDGHSTSVSVCGVWGIRTEVQVFMRKLHTHIHLDYVKVEILSCIKKKKKVLPGYQIMVAIWGTTTSWELPLLLGIA